MTDESCFDARTAKIAPTCTDFNPTTFDAVHDMDYRNASSMEIQMWICNLTGLDIIIKDRMGTETRIKPANAFFNRHSTNEIAIFEEYKYFEGAFPKQGDLTDNAKDSPGEVKTKDLFRRGISDINSQIRTSSPQRYRHRSKETISIKQTISLEALKSSGGGLYVPSIDRVICLDHAEHDFQHPNSVKGEALKKQQNSKLEGKFSFSISMRDRQRQYGTRWINISGEAFLVSSDETGLEEDGITVTYTTNGNITTKHMSLSEGAKELKLYRTREEALREGDTVGNLQREIERLKLETSQQTAKNKHSETIYDSVKKEREYEDFKQRADAERESMRRKNFHEMLKLAPVVLSTVLTLIVIIRKA